MAKDKENLYELEVALCSLVGIAEDAVGKEEFEKLDNAGAEIIECLAELERYKAIGTVEEIQQKLAELDRWHTSEVNANIKNVFANTSTSICHNCDHKDEYIEELESEVAEYKAIGTIEDFKALKEKSVSKKAIRRKGMCYAKAKDGTEDYEIIEECPTCKNRLYAVSFNVGYCKCGQRITI